MLNEISLFKGVAFSLAEVQELFNDGVPLDATAHSQSANLTGYWRNDGASSWSDRSTNSNDGTPAGSPDTILLPEGTTSGKDILGFPLTHTNNGWLNLSGSEYVRVDNSMDFREDGNTNLYSIEFWYKPDTISVDDMGLIGFGNSIIDGSGTWMIQNDAGTLRYTHQEGWITIGTAVVGTWGHIAVTYDGVSTRTYFNKALVTTTVEGNDSATNNNTYLFIGTTYGTQTQGQIDEARIYNKVLSLAEIEKNYKHGLSKHS
jgi:hypothetical protein